MISFAWLSCSSSLVFSAPCFSLVSKIFSVSSAESVLVLISHTGPSFHSLEVIKSSAPKPRVRRSAEFSLPGQCFQSAGFVSIWSSWTQFLTNYLHLCASLCIHFKAILESVQQLKEQLSRSNSKAELMNLTNLAPSEAANNSNLGKVILFRGANLTLDITNETAEHLSVVVFKYTYHPQAFSETSVKTLSTCLLWFSSRCTIHRPFQKHRWRHWALVCCGFQEDVPSIGLFRNIGEDTELLSVVVFK